MAAKKPKVAKLKKKKEFYFKAWFINALRGISRRYPPIYETRNAAKETYYITTKTGKQVKRVRFKCSNCGNYYANGDIRVDHRTPVVDSSGFPTLDSGEPNWNVYIANMFCSSSNLDVLCVGCHDIKSKHEQEERKKLKDNKK